MSENLSSTKHAIGKLKGKPQTGRKYLHMKFLIKRTVFKTYQELHSSTKETKFQVMIGRCLNRCFNSEDTQMAKMRVKTHTAALVIMRMLIKTSQLSPTLKPHGL